MSDQKLKLAAGSPAPEFRLPASTGGEVELADYRSKANVASFARSPLTQFLQWIILAALPPK